MEQQKTKIEVWEVLHDQYDNFPKLSYPGLFCVLRKRGLITRGEWYYLHGFLEKHRSMKQDKSYKFRHSEDKELIKQIIKELKSNENKT